MNITRNLGLNPFKVRPIASYFEPPHVLGVSVYYMDRVFFAVHVKENRTATYREKYFNETDITSDIPSRVFSFTEYFDGCNSLDKKLVLIMNDIYDCLEINDFNRLDMFFQNVSDDVEIAVVVALLRLTFDVRYEILSWGTIYKNLKSRLEKEGKLDSTILRGIEDSN